MAGTDSTDNSGKERVGPSYTQNNIKQRTGLETAGKGRKRHNRIVVLHLKRVARGTPEIRADKSIHNPPRSGREYRRNRTRATHTQRSRNNKGRVRTGFRYTHTHKPEKTQHSLTLSCVRYHDVHGTTVTFTNHPSHITTTSDTPHTDLHIPVAKQQLGTAGSSLADGDGELLPRRQPLLVCPARINRTVDDNGSIRTQKHWQINVTDQGAFEESRKLGCLQPKAALGTVCRGSVSTVKLNLKSGIILGRLGMLSDC